MPPIPQACLNFCISHGLILSRGRCAWLQAEPLMTIVTQIMERGLISQTAAIWDLASGRPQRPWVALVLSLSLFMKDFESINVRKPLSPFEPISNQSTLFEVLWRLRSLFSLPAVEVSFFGQFFGGFLDPVVNFTPRAVASAIKPRESMD
jgi:hypothetical protein